MNEKDINEYYFDIGYKIIFGDRDGADDDNLYEDAIKEGKSWFDKNREKLCKILKDHKLVLILKNEGAASEKYKSAIIDLLLVAYTNLPILSIASLIIHFGEDKICRKSDSKVITKLQP